MFHTVPPEERIDASDAEIVDVIHTAGLWVGTDGVVTNLICFTLQGSSQKAGPRLRDSVSWLPPTMGACLRILGHTFLFFLHN